MKKQILIGLNEFNLSDANYKDLDKSFGPVEILHSFETNLLIIQEDKISSVLLSKQALAAAEGSGVVATSTSVLGVQRARIEEYGISNNPESFVAFGQDRFFTDTKRGAIIQLKGTGGASDALKVISEVGMRSYFRDEFNINPQTQKLGGFDPYMNEYVLTSTDILLPNAVSTYSEIPVECGAFFGPYNYDDPVTYIINLSEAQGNVVVDYKITGVVDLDWEWGVTTGSVPGATGVGTFNFDKDEALPTTMTLIITPTGSYTMKAIVRCPATYELTIIQITLGDLTDAGLFIHDEYYWDDGTILSPVSSELTAFAAPTILPWNRVARYESTVGVSSEGIFPPDNATVNMASNKIDFDTLVFDNAGLDADKFQYYVSNTLYTDSTADINTLLGLAATAVPITNPSTGYYTAPFTYTNPANDSYLYLIYNYSAIAPSTLFYGSSGLNVCCLGVSGTYYLNSSTLATATAIYTDANLTILATDGFYRQSPVAQSRELSGGLLLPAVACASPCNIFYISGVQPLAANFCSGPPWYAMTVATQTITNNAYLSVTIGDYLDVVPLTVPGFIAFSPNFNDDTQTGTFRIIEVAADGEILDLLYGNLGVCGTPV